MEFMYMIGWEFTTQLLAETSTERKKKTVQNESQKRLCSLKRKNNLNVIIFFSVALNVEADMCFLKSNTQKNG